MRRATADFILVLHELPGRPLTQAVFDEAMPCTAENLIMLLDSLPPEVVRLRAGHRGPVRLARTRR